jgi:hypothetical protein
LHVFAIAGVVLFAGMALIVFNYIKALAQMKPTHEKRFAKNEGLIGLNPILNNSSKTGNVKPIVKPT